MERKIYFILALLLLFCGRVQAQDTTQVVILYRSKRMLRTGYDSNRIKEQIEFNGNGVKHGYYIKFYPHGKQQEFGYYYNGEKDSYWLYRYPSGRTKIKRYYRMGVPVWKYKEFHENREDAVRGRYRKGKKSGCWRYYNEEGKLIKRVYYKRGIEKKGYLDYLFSVRDEKLPLLCLEGSLRPDFQVRKTASPTRKTR